MHHSERQAKEPKRLKTRKPLGLRRTARILTILLRIIPKVMVAGRFFVAKVINRHMLERDGSLIVVANHRSNMDIPYVWVPQGRPMMFVAKAELWSVPVLGWVMRALGHIPVDRKDPRSRANVQVFGEEILKNDGRLLYFFEGTTHQLPYDDERVLGKTYDGACVLAIKTNTPILAAGLRGTSEVGNLFTAIFRRPAVRTAFAPRYLYPQDFLRQIGLPEGVKPTHQETLKAARRMTEELEVLITHLVKSPVL